MAGGGRPPLLSVVLGEASGGAQGFCGGQAVSGQVLLELAAPLRLRALRLEAYGGARAAWTEAPSPPPSPAAAAGTRLEAEVPYLDARRELLLAGERREGPRGREGGAGVAGRDRRPHHPRPRRVGDWRFSKEPLGKLPPRSGRTTVPIVHDQPAQNYSPQGAGWIELLFLQAAFRQADLLGSVSHHPQPVLARCDEGFILLEAGKYIFPFSFQLSLQLSTITTFKGIFKKTLFNEKGGCHRHRYIITYSLFLASFSVGEVIPIYAEIENCSSRLIVPKAAIFQIQTYMVRGKTKTFRQMVANVRGNHIASGSTDTWNGKTLKIPPVTPSIFDCCIIRVEYSLAVYVHIPGAKKLMVELPFVIGTIPCTAFSSRNSSLVSQLAMDMRWLAQTLPDHPEAPPNYADIVSEEEYARHVTVYPTSADCDEQLHCPVLAYIQEFRFQPPPLYSEIDPFPAGVQDNQPVSLVD
ncbi:hypothetical protein Chor_001454 [Crotalus horridus]